MSAQVSFVLSQFTRLTDGRTDGHFACAKTTLHRCSAVIITKKYAQLRANMHQTLHRVVGCKRMLKYS